jgi:3-oxoacyl-[acyl-carrier protein] reductase
VNIKDQVILISGATGSVGSFIAEELAKDAKKIILVDKNPDRLIELSQKIFNTESYSCDLTNPDEVIRTIGLILSEHEVTVLINLAGLIHSEPIINLFNRDSSRHSFSSWDETIKSNLYTTFYLSALIAEAMVKGRRKGVIINTSSVAAQGNLGQTAYSAAKAGIEAMTKVWSKELGIFKIRCACVAPGFLNTPSTHHSLSEAAIEKWKKLTPIGKLGELKDFSDAIRFIIENDFYNGKVLQLDGGLSI